jgi:hypothetical protein
MIHTKQKMQDVVSGFTCDCCQKLISVDDGVGHQEALHINFVGGYESVFGDGTQVQCDLCQECILKILGKFCRKSNHMQNILKNCFSKDN